MATLARATGDVAKSQDALGVAMDVAAATGKDLGSVTDALAKGFSGNTASLGKLVPGLDKTVVASKDMNKIMAELARTTGGSAAAAADTAEGKMARMKLAMDETKESIGGALLPALTVLASMLLTVANWAQENSTVFVILLGVIGSLAAAVLAYNSVQKVAKVATAVWTAAQWLLNAALTANPIGLIVAGVVALIAAIVLVATKTKFFQTVWASAMRVISAAIQAVFGWIKANWPLLLAILTGPIGIAVALIVTQWDKIKAAALAVYVWLRDTFNKIWSTITSAATKALGLVLGPIEDIRSAFDAVVRVIREVIDWLGKIKIPDIGGAIKKLNPFKAAPQTFGSFVGTSAGTLTASSRSSGSAAGSRPPTIIIQGAIDPASTARQVRQILRDDERRRGGVRIGRPAAIA